MTALGSRRARPRLRLVPSPPGDVTVAAEPADPAALGTSAAQRLGLSLVVVVAVLTLLGSIMILSASSIIIVGGNIRGYTRTMTTAIALETSKGDLALALALGLILITLSVVVTALTFWLNRRIGVR